jgi:hypothetical protein
MTTKPLARIKNAGREGFVGEMFNAEREKEAKGS